MTPQEQYPKFYSHPHYWIDAIEVEVNCDTTGTYRTIKKGEIFQLSALTVHEFQSMSAFQNLTPKFEAQEGEQFLKDLEAAVSAGCYDEPVTKSLETKWDITFILNLDDEASIVIVKAGLDISLSHGVTFNGALYVDKLRELGYYL